ncbi:MAG: beta-glucuronidase, partial [Prevotella sp.]|nr:beta-glucuronidase [Prevotella sp.]
MRARHILSFILYLVVSHAAAQQTVSLAGAWDFALERGAEGNSSLFTQPSSLYTDYVMLPGSMLTNGKGDLVSVKTQWTGSLYDSSFYFNPYMAKYRMEGQMKFPFFLTPERHYVGAAWYHRQVYVSKTWKDQRVTLFLERPHIETTVYVNGKEVGHQMSLSTPHRYDITDCLKFGANNDIAIRVYNGIENVCVGQDSHSVTDQTQGNWNGIVGRLELQAQPRKLNIRHVRVTPDIANGRVRVMVEMENHVDGVRIVPLRDYGVTVTVRPIVNGKPASASYYNSKEAFGSKKEFDIDISDNMRLWDEYRPNLYRLTVAAGDDVYETTFGIREIAVKGRQLLINGRPLYLRGTVENCCFPETGYPPTDEQEWLRIFRKCKEYGLNHVRFHSYCPPEAAFAAADRVGIYLQPEGPSWPNHGVRLRRGQKIDQYLLEESKRIVDEYGHHPSFVMMAAGNEPAGDWVTYCNQWVKEMKQYDPTKIYAGASVGGGWAWDSGSEYHVKGGARGLDEWNKRAPSSDNDYYSGIEYPRNYKPIPKSGEDGRGLPNQSPIVTHEKGQWCAFPDFREIPQYTGA